MCHSPTSPQWQPLPPAGAPPRPPSGSRTLHVCRAQPSQPGAPAHPGVWMDVEVGGDGGASRGPGPPGAQGRPEKEAPAPGSSVLSGEGGQGAGTTRGQVWLRLVLVWAGALGTAGPKDGPCASRQRQGPLASTAPPPRPWYKIHTHIKIILHALGVGFPSAGPRRRQPGLAVLPPSLIHGMKLVHEFFQL